MVAGECCICKSEIPKGRINFWIGGENYICGKCKRSKKHETWEVESDG